MPELPEVETTLRGIAPHIKGKKITQTLVHQAKLRWQIPSELAEILHGQTLCKCLRHVNNAFPPILA